MELSFGMLKPDCLDRKLSWFVLELIERAGLSILALRKLRLLPFEVDIIYRHCAHKDFFPNLKEMMISSEVVVFAVAGADAVQRLNKVVGHTDPAEAKAGSIRGHGESLRRNLIHSAESSEQALKSIGLFFPVEEMANWLNL